MYNYILDFSCTQQIHAAMCQGTALQRLGDLGGHSLTHETSIQDLWFQLVSHAFSSQSSRELFAK